MRHHSSLHSSAPVTPARLRARSASWPRCYMQRLASGQIFEVCRGREAESYTMVDHLQPSLAAGWRCWVEYPIRDCVRIGGAVARALTPAA